MECFYCGGTGLYNSYAYHENDDEPCPHCAGSGEAGHGYDPYYQDEWYEHWDDDADDDWPFDACETEQWTHYDDHTLTFLCEACGQWHNTQAGDLMDANYADVLPMPAYEWADIPF